jgi:hypothetical protein
VYVAGGEFTMKDGAKISGNTGTGGDGNCGNGYPIDDGNSGYGGDGGHTTRL